MKPKILFIVSEYPQLSQTYIKAEIEALQSDYEIFVITTSDANLPYTHHVPFKMIRNHQLLLDTIQQFKPEIIHAHYLLNIKLAELLARTLDLPYTVRTHSFDVLKGNYRVQVSDYCLGVLTFPFTHKLIEKRGVPGEKIIDCYPVIDYSMFYDRSPNGDSIINLGASLPKKRFEDFIDLAKLMPDMEFNLYPIGYENKKIVEYNERNGYLVNIKPLVEPEEMKNIYKHHRWLVYTACPKLKTVGWPLAVAEAQACGLGVCIQNIRPDIEEYLGGAGFLFDSINELPAILSKPYPDEMREKGFEHAKKSDIQVHKIKLTGLWDKIIKN